MPRRSSNPTASPRRCAAICLTAFVFLFIAEIPALAQHALPTHHVPQAVLNSRARFVGALLPTQELQIDILLPIRDQAGLDKFLHDVYDPASPSYRHFLTPAQFTERFGPTQDDYDAVAQFAEANGMIVTYRSPNRLVLGVTSPVVNIERAFHVKMGVYLLSPENRVFFAPDREPSADIPVPLWHIGGLDNSTVPRPLYVESAMGPGAGSNTTGSGPNGSFLGSDRRAAYYGQTALTGSGQSVGLFELDGYNVSDVQAYFTNVGQSLNVPINNVLIDGASAGSDGDDREQVIDIIESASMAPSLSQVLMFIGPLRSFASGKTDTDIFNQMAQDGAVKQFSCSWAWKPDDPKTDDPVFDEMAADGQELFVASGDSGSYPNSSAYYFPAEDAHVTAVGGTDLVTNGAGGSWSSETAWSDSGGGISPDHIPIPQWQQLSGAINQSNGGSTVYRNVPDVAAEANLDNYYCANGICGTGLGGTSLAAPTWAGFIALANQQYVASKGSGSVGFINSGIYAIGVGSGYNDNLHDITSGSNGGFSAVTGYDLVTGWGSPSGCTLIGSLTGVASCQQPSASVSPTSLNIVSSGGNPAYGSATLTNNGPGTLSISSVQVTGGADLSLSSKTCGASLGQGDSCTATVEFNPGGFCTSPETGTLYFYDNAVGGDQAVSIKASTVRCSTRPAAAQSALPRHDASVDPRLRDGDGRAAP